MADFDPAWTFLMELEGGDLMHEVQGDPGGRTRFGIAESFHPDMWHDGPPGEEDARTFYRERYWSVLRLGKIESQEIAEEIFELAVHATTPREGRPNVAIRTAQQAVNDVRARKGEGHVAEDGLVGPETLRALNALGRRTIDTLAWDGRFNLRQLLYYYERPGEHVSKFFRGWTRRVWA